MKKVTGDLVALALDGEFDVIVHGCNCRRVMGAGVAAELRRVFPEVYALDRLTREGSSKLGEITTVVTHRIHGNTTRGLAIVNAYTQDRYGTDEKHLDERALSSCLVRVDNLFGGGALRIGMPLIGCGRAGGDWATLKRVMHEVFGAVIPRWYTVVARPGEEPEKPWL